MRFALVVVAGLLLGSLVARAQSSPPPIGPDARSHLQQLDAHLLDATNQARILVEAADSSAAAWARVKTEASRDLGRALADAEEHAARIHRLPNHQIVDDEAFRNVERELAFAQEDYRELRRVLDDPSRERVRDRAATLYQTLRETDAAFSRLADTVNIPRVEQVRPQPTPPPVYDNRDLMKQHPAPWQKDAHPLDRNNNPPPGFR